MVLDLRNPWNTGLNVISIDGVGPGDANISIADFGGLDGGAFNSARLPSRTITMKLGFLENPMVEDSRHLTYKYFPIKRPVELVFTTDRRKMSITGYVESNEPDIFSKESSTTIKIKCPSPYFIRELSYDDDPSLHYISFIERSGGFEFPLTNPYGDETLSFSEITVSTSKNIFYEGDSPGGLEIMIKASGPVFNPYIWNKTTNERLTINTSVRNLNAGDWVFISTVPGHKAIQYLTGGMSVNAISTFDKGSSWVRVTSGDNMIQWGALGGESNMAVEISYETLYDGI